MTASEVAEIRSYRAAALAVAGIATGLTLRAALPAPGVAAFVGLLPVALALLTGIAKSGTAWGL